MTISTTAQVLPPTLFGALKRHTICFLACGISGGLIALGIAYALPKQWPATLLFQIGQVGSGAALLADPNNVIQRVSFPGFVNQVLRAEHLDTQEPLDRRSALIKKSMTAAVVKGGTLIEMSVKGYSPEEAKASLLGAFQVLQAEHAALLTPSVTRMEKNLGDARISLQKIEEERTAILEPIRKITGASTIEKKFSESILLASLLKSSDAEVRAFRDQINSLDEQLSPYRTFNTKEVAAVYVPQRAVFPKNGIAAAIGVVLGLLLAGLVVLVRDKELRGALADLTREDTAKPAS